MSNVSPDLGALYLRHRDAMHKVAASVLREAGRASEAADAVQEAILSVMTSPPRHVRNWEAFLVVMSRDVVESVEGYAANRRVVSVVVVEVEPAGQRQASFGL